MDQKILTMRKLFPILLSFVLVNSVSAQDSLLNMLEDSSDAASQTFPVKATFKAIHIVNAHTIESPAKHDLNFIIMHRFGKLNDGAYNFFGLDNASIRLGLDYGISDRLGIGIGRSSLDKTFDGYLKYKLIRQTQGKVQVPVSLSVLASISNYTLKFQDKPFLNAKYRTAYTTQLLLARKFTSAFSLQLSPTWVHYNLVPTTADNNDIFAAMIGGRLKFNKRMGITFEYNYMPSGQVESIDVHNSLSLGWDIETGGHVFQLVFSNSQGMIESQYIGRTPGEWGEGDIYFGFNISRNFSLGKKKTNVKKDW
jgi:hypothetical protein